MSIFYTLINVSILSSVTIGAVILTKWIFKSKLNTVLLSALWMLVLVRLLMPLSIESPIHIGEIIPERLVEEPILITETEANTTPAEDNLTSDEYMIPGEAFDLTHNENLLENNTQPALEQNEPTFFQSVGAYIKRVQFETILLSVWIVVGAIILIKGFLSLALFTRKLRGENVVSTKLYNAFMDARRNLEINKSVRILESDNVDMPMTFGLIHPKIVVPKEMVDAIDAKKLRLIITHELVHIKRLDILKNYLWLMAKAIHWFNPLVWIGYKLYLSDMEIICDTKVIEKVNLDDRAVYSQSLVDAAKLLTSQQKRISPIMLSFCEENCKLRRRIMNIMKPNKQSRSVSLAVVLIILILIGACFTTACQKQEEMLELEPIENTAEPTAESTDEPSADLTAEQDEQLSVNESLYSWSETRTIDDIDVKVNIDIQTMDVSDRERYPVLYASPRDFDDEIAKTAAQYFLGSTYYSPVLTKDDYEKIITDIEETFAYLSKNISYVESDVQDKIDELNIEKETAPDENIIVNADQIIISRKSYQFNYETDYAESAYLKAYSENGSIMQFGVVNIGYDKGYLYFTRDVEREYLTYFNIKELHNIDESDYESMYDEALQQATEAVAVLDGTMMFSHASKGVGINSLMRSLCEETHVITDSDSPCYFFYFYPVIDGIDMLKVSSYSADHDYGEVQMTEYIEVAVDKDGIAQLRWYASLMADEYVQKEVDAKVISPEQAIDILKENIFSIEEWNEHSLYKCSLDINQLSFGMVTIRDEGQLKIVPAYRFQGVRDNPVTKEDDDGYYIAIYNKQVIINAIDGTIISYN